MKRIIVVLFALLLSLAPCASYAVTTIFTTTALNGTDDGDSDSNTNQGLVFTPGTLSSAVAANQIRVTFLFGTASPVSPGAVTSIWIGRGAGSGSLDYNGNQCQLLVGGSSSFGGSSALSVTTDFCTFGASETFDNTKDLVIRFHFLTGTSVSVSASAIAAVPGVAFGFNTGADNSGATTAGYTTNLGAILVAISKIEVQTGGSGTTTNLRTLMGVGQ